VSFELLRYYILPILIFLALLLAFLYVIFEGLWGGKR
jgi:hypothetical protein